MSSTHYLCVSNDPDAGDDGPAGFRDGGLPFGLNEDFNQWTGLAKRTTSDLTSWGKTTKDSITGWTGRESKAFTEYLKRRAEMIRKWIDARREQVTDGVGSLTENRGLVDDDDVGDGMANTMLKGYTCTALPANAAAQASRVMKRTGAPQIRQPSGPVGMPPGSGPARGLFDDEASKGEDVVDKIVSMYQKMYEKMMRVFRRNVQKIKQDLKNPFE